MTSARLYEGVAVAPWPQPATMELAPVWNDARPWPVLDRAALYGLAGRFVATISPHSEADTAALLMQFLAVFGCGIGSSAHFYVEATQHTGRVFILVMGYTSGGRKGTSMDQVMRVFTLADPEWIEGARISGVGSGEAVIDAVRDREDGEPAEKRRLIVEPEFSRTLAAGARDSSILNAVIRDAWDSGRLQNLTRKNPAIAKNAHISIIGHITEDELRAKLTSTEIANGFINRFLLTCAKRSKKLPHGGALLDSELIPIARALRTALDFARGTERMRRTPAANAEWEEFYNAVPEARGLLGAVTARAEAQTLRLSLLYALLDGSAIIDVEHLRAAIAVWNYAHGSAQYVFGASLGDDVAERILAEIRAVYPSGLTRELVRAIFSRHVPAARITTAITYLVERGLATTERLLTDGRPQEITRAVAPSEDRL